MHTVTFETDKNGNNISIPYEFLDEVGQHFKVIIINTESEVQRKVFTKDDFKAFSIPYGEIKFTREEANER